MFHLYWEYARFLGIWHSGFMRIFLRTIACAVFTWTQLLSVLKVFFIQLYTSEVLAATNSLLGCWWVRIVIFTLQKSRNPGHQEITDDSQFFYSDPNIIFFMEQRICQAICVWGILKYPQSRINFFQLFITNQWSLSDCRKILEQFTLRTNSEQNIFSYWLDINQSHGNRVILDSILYID